MTQPQERHRQTTSDVQLIKNYYYTATQWKQNRQKHQRGDHRADGDQHWGAKSWHGWKRFSLCMIKQQKLTGPFTFPLIHKVVLYFLQCNFDLILLPKWLKGIFLKRRKMLDMLAFCASAFEKHKNHKVRFSLQALRILKDEMRNCISLLLDWIKTVINEAFSLSSSLWFSLHNGPVLELAQSALQHFCIIL